MIGKQTILSSVSAGTRVDGRVVTTSASHWGVLVGGGETKKRWEGLLEGVMTKTGVKGKEKKKAILGSIFPVPFPASL